MRKTLIIFLICISNLGFSQVFKSVNKSDTLDYSELDVHPLPLLLDSNYEYFSFLDTIVSGSKVFFIGENHQYRLANVNLQLNFIKYLNRQIQLRNVVTEFGYARGFMVDTYINSEDSSYGETLKNYSYPEYFHFYRELRKLNQTLPDSLKIHVYGIDVERFYDVPMKLMFLQINKDKTPHDSIVLHIESLRGIVGYLDKMHSEASKTTKREKGISSYFGYSYRGYNTEKTMVTIIENFFKFEDYYKDFLGDSSFQIYKRVAMELRDNQIYDNYSGTPQQTVYREAYMYRKFIRLYNDMPNEKFFGQFGRCHISEARLDNPCNWFDFNSIVHRINQTDSVGLKNNVCTFAYFYQDDDSYDDPIVSGGRIRKIFKHVGDIDTISAIRITQDTAWFGKFTDLYNYLIYDNRTISEAATFEETEEVEDYYDNSSGNVAFGTGVQYVFHDFSDFNSFFNSKNFNNLSNNLAKITFNGQINSLSGFCLGTNVNILPEITLFNSIDTVKLKLKGHSVSLDFGWNVLSSEYIFIKPSFGLNISSFTMRLSDSEDRINKDLDVFGNPASQRFNISMYSIDPSLEFIFKYHLLGLSIRGGYYYTPIKNHWRNNFKEEMANSPSQTMNGFYLQSSFLLMFDF